MQGAVLSALSKLSHLILQLTLWPSYHYCNSYFIHVKLAFKVTFIKPEDMSTLEISKHQVPKIWFKWQIFKEYTKEYDI